MGLAAQQPASSAAPSPMKFFEAVNSYQRTAALKTALELNLFTTIAEGASTAESIAKQVESAARGIRILCDFLVIQGFLSKTAAGYALTPDSAMFLNRKSHAYIGDAIHFLLNPQSQESFARLTEAVRNGGTVLEENGATPENPVWISFARSMMPMMVPLAQTVAAIVSLPMDRPSKVLDIAASHGMYGISLAKRYPRAHIVGLDWKNVLELTRENAQRFGVGERYSTIAGDAFTVDFGSDYDLILLPNILHHFDLAACESLLAKCRRSLRPAGSIAIIEFVPNEDRVSPPVSAGFALIMLAQTPAGDAYTLREFQQMLSASGFGRPEAYPLLPADHMLIVSKAD